MSEIWQPEFQTLSPAFEIFSWLPAEFFTKINWPNLADYNALSNSIYNDLGMQIQFVLQAKKSPHFSDNYEVRIYLTGEVQTRVNNWHDFFNMLIWQTFPRSKALLNTLQYQELKSRLGSSQQRSSLENFLTLFDENGAIVVSSDETLLAAIRHMQWKEIFWRRRQSLQQHLACFIVGHSLHEKLLNPYLGMVGHSLLLSVPHSFFSLTLSQQRQAIDRLVMDYILQSLEISPKNLFPVPVLGFPNWYAATENIEFYDNTRYFRSQRAIQ